MNFSKVVKAGFPIFLYGSAATYSSNLSAEASPADEPTSDVEEVIVIGSRKANYTEITESAEKLVVMPGSLGDPLGAITALPGVISPVGGGAPAVRGSSPNDNRYFIDGLPAGYIFHQFNTSILDESVIQDFQIFTAGFGAQYAGATGAIFDVRLRDPKHIDFQTTINASLLRAGIFLESAVTDNSAFYLSAREGLIQFFIPEEDEPNDEGFRVISAPEDRDYQFKYLIDLNDRNSLSVLFAGAEDYAEAEITETVDFVQENPDFAGEAMLGSSFDSQGVTWSRDGTAGARTSLSLARFSNRENMEFGDGYYVDKELEDFVLKGYWLAPVTDKHTVTFGFDINNYKYDFDARLVLFVCSEFNESTCQDNREDDVFADQQIIKIKDSAAYVTDLWQVSPKLSIETGIQWSRNNYTDETFYNPRISFELQTWQRAAITGSAGKYNQLPHIDNLIPGFGNPQLKSPTAEHFTAGLKGEWQLNWDWSVEFYHKNLANLPLALDDSQPDAELLYSNDVSGTAQGVDIFLNRNLADRWYGWLALSYSQSERTDERTNITQDYFLDTPLVLNLVGNYQISELWNAGFRFTAKSGQASTEIIGVKPNPEFEDKYLPVYGEPYQDRLPTFARLDIRFERKTIWWPGTEGKLYFDILNATNRKNVESIKLDYERVNETGDIYLEKDIGLGLFPSIGASITF